MSETSTAEVVVSILEEHRAGALVAGRAFPDKVELHHKLEADLGLDSLDLVELVFDLEDSFFFFLGDGEAETAFPPDATVADVVAFAERRRPATESATP